MNRKNVTVAAAALAVVLAGAYPASSWYFGKQIEAAHAESIRIITAQPYFKLLRHDYERSLFGASEVVTLEVPTALFRLPARPAAPKAAPEAGDEETPDAGEPPAPPPLPPLRITLKTSIQHGPLPGFNGLAAGSSSTLVEFGEPYQKKITEAFGGKPPLEIRTHYDFLGGGRATLTSPALKLVLPAADGAPPATFTGNGLEMSVEFSRGLQQLDLRASAPRFELAEANGARLLLAGMRTETRQQRIFEDDPLLYSGTQQFSLAEASFTPGSEHGSKIALKEIKYDVQMPVAGEFIDLVAQLGAAELRVGEQNYGPAHYDLSLKHVNARKLSALNRSLMALYTQPEVLQDTNRLLQAFAPMKDQLVALLLDNPTLSMDRVSFNTPQGEARLGASLKLVDPKADDFANPMMLMAKIDFAADVVFPAALITALPGDPATDGADEEQAQQRRQMTEQTLARFIEQGYATLDNGMLKSRISFHGGQLLVNDKPFNPMAMVQPPALEDLPK